MRIFGRKPGLWAGTVDIQLSCIVDEVRQLELIMSDPISQKAAGGVELERRVRLAREGRWTQEVARLRKEVAELDALPTENASSVGGSITHC